jgi:superfamily II DNA or RNA helicase
VSAFNILFSPPKLIQTQFGPRYIQTGFPTPDFWAAWRGSKDSLRSLGYSVFKNRDGRFVVNLWSEDAYKPKPPAEIVGYEIKNQTGLYKYQVPHVGALCAALWKFGSALDASDTGTGKSFAAIAAYREMEIIPAIVCPKSVISAWEGVCAHFGVQPLFVRNWESCKSRKFAYGGFTFQKDYKWKIGLKKVGLIFDEAHKAKGDYTQNAKMVIAAKEQGVMSLLLSATIAESPRDMRAIGYMLGLHDMISFREWTIGLGCFLIDDRDKWGCTDPRAAMTKIRDEIFPAKGNRISIKDLGDAFPETQISAQAYDIEKADEQNKAYAFLLAEIDRLQAEGTENLQAAFMVLNLRYRQLTELLKVDLLAELAEDYLENGLSVVIFVNFKETMKLLADRLFTHGVSTIHGGQTRLERDGAIRAFQEDGNHICIANVGAGGVGVSLHDVKGERPRASLICPTYNAKVLKQVLGRIHRAGGKSKSLQRLIYARGTVEEKVCRSVALKIEAIGILNDGDLMEADLLGLIAKEKAEIERLAEDVAAQIEEADK